MSNIEKYIDSSMYPAAPMPTKDPKVTLLSMTPDPLGAMAAAYRMYKGIPTSGSLSEITDEERREAWEEVQKTHLKAPYEFVDLHFFIEGVPRSFTHQMVRQRTAVYAQESLRFAVKENLSEAVQYPPSLQGTDQRARDLRDTWDNCITDIEETYNYLVQNGVPAEDAREILPQATLTRLNYKTNLRNLLEHAGNRLCTQAQFIWRSVFIQMVQAIRDYQHDYFGQQHAWQFELIAMSGVFAPVCYELGHCPFQAQVDRGCTIRDRVEAFSRAGVPSKEWAVGIGRPTYHESGVEVIYPHEWLSDPRAAWQ